ncbi:hypothetical protein GCM10009811_12080 [Nostocoides veronense]|uniref:Uncharacterized protein n=1 Tax=Nostocoides veronense TaxID=330836 RepID=A0ABN2LHM0_9MICO
MRGDLVEQVEEFRKATFEPSGQPRAELVDRDEVGGVSGDRLLGRRDEIGTALQRTPPNDGEDTGDRWAEDVGEEVRIEGDQPLRGPLPGQRPVSPPGRVQRAPDGEQSGGQDGHVPEDVDKPGLDRQQISGRGVGAGAQGAVDGGERQRSGDHGPPAVGPRHADEGDHAVFGPPQFAQRAAVPRCTPQQPGEDHGAGRRDKDDRWPAANRQHHAGQATDHGQQQPDPRRSVRQAKADDRADRHVE